MSDGTTAEPAEVVTADDVPEIVQEQAQAPGQDSDDALFDAMEAEQFGEPEKPAGTDLQAKDIAPDLHEPEAGPEPEIEAVPDNLIDPDREYLFKDAEGNEYKVKGSDAIYQTTKYHRKMQEINDRLKEYEPLEQMFANQKGELVHKVLATADPTERFEALRRALQDNGLIDMAQDLQQRMQQSGIQYDPMQAQQRALEQQQRQLQDQQRQFEAQNRIREDRTRLESSLGRQLTAREMDGINSVFGNWMQARQANPNLAMPSFEGAYKLAQDAIKFEDSQRTQTVTQAPKPERVNQTSRPEPKVMDDDELFAAMAREQGLSY